MRKALRCSELVLVLLACLLYQVEAHKHADAPLLLLVTLDGFRHDYVDRYNMTYLAQIRSENSSWASHGLRPVFPTLTWPNFVSMVTGLYPESTGVVDNFIYDPVLEKEFDLLNPNITEDIEFSGEAIWSTNIRIDHERKSAVSSNWPGFSNRTGRDVLSVTLDPNSKPEDLIDKFVGLFVDEHEPINFGAVYIEEPDHTGHQYGPDSTQMRDLLQKIDKLIEHLVSKLASNHLVGKINVIITSDHGMTNVNSSSIIPLSKYVDTGLFDMYGSYPVANLFLKNKTSKSVVYESLKRINNVRVYLKEDLPDELHLKRTSRIGDIVVLADLGFLIVRDDSLILPNSNKAGMHGYSNTDTSMHPLFVAFGPAFKANYSLDQLNTEDMYELMCRVLEIDEPAANNGTIDNVTLLLLPKKVKYMAAYVILAITPVISAALTVLGLFMINKTTDLPGQSDHNTRGYHMVSTSDTNALLRSMENGDLDDDDDDDDDNVEILNLQASKSSKPKISINI